MSTAYQLPTTTVPRIQELPTITATELKNSTADVFEQVAAKQAIAITRQRPEWLEKLHEEYRGMLERMQGPEQRAGAEKLFRATPEELGQAALWAAQQKAKSKS